MKTAIVYHFFANYRKPICEHLLFKSDDEFIFVADEINRAMPGVPVWSPPEEAEFVKARCIFFPLGFLYQHSVVGLAFRKDVQTIIYLGNWKYISTWISAALARLSGKRVLFWTHGWLVPESGINRIVRKTFYRLANGLLLYGNRARQIGIAEGFDPSNLYVVLNSLDYQSQKDIFQTITASEVKAIREKIFNEPDLPILFLIGRLSKSKRIDLLFEAAMKLSQKGNRVNILIVGDGDARESLETLFSPLKENVHFYGSCHDEPEIAKLLRCSEVTVCPAAAGLTVVHSLAYGVPVVTGDDWSTQGPEVEGIIPGVTGDFFEAGNVDSLVEVLEDFLFLNPKDRSLDCRQLIGKFYNAEFQEMIISEAIRSVPAENIPELDREWNDL